MIFPPFLECTPLAGLFPSLYLLLITLRVFGLRMRQKDSELRQGWVWVWAKTLVPELYTTQRDAVSGDILEWRKGKERGDGCVGGEGKEMGRTSEIRGIPML